MSSELAAPLAPPAGMPFLRPLAVLRRRGAVIGAVLAAALLAVASIAALWPATYVSTGTILIEQQELPTELVRSTISTYASQRIQVITQRVMTSANLLQIIEKYDLYAAERRKRGRETIVQMMRDDINIRTISADVIDPSQGRPVQATIAFALGYQSHSPELAARVANELYTLYLRENVVTRQAQAADATAFLSDNAGKRRGEMAAIEAKLAAFKERNFKNLPEVAQVNLQRLMRGDEQRRDIEQQLRMNEQQFVFIESQLAQTSASSRTFISSGEQLLSRADRLKMLQSDYDRKLALYSAEHPEVKQLRRQIEGLGGTLAATVDENERLRQLRQAETDLAVARQGRTDDHPDVARLTRLVEGLRSAPTAAQVALPKASADAADNPAYIQLLTKLETLAMDKRDLVQRRAAMDALLADLDNSLELSPGVEQEYAALRRDYENAQANYRDALQKQTAAQDSQSLETEQKGERFSQLETPLEPQDPVSPNRPMIATLGVFMALIVSAGIALALELLDGSIRGAPHLSSLLTAPPLAVIPRFTTRVASRRRVRLLVALAAGAVVAGGVGLVLIDRFYRPLDVLWAVILRKLGG
jgi:uncharacterized protein involved in exopolysaccharide biosynthesis